ncbi:L,D-transpeptidase family protein [Sorangium atrum]|uniref:L,D-transpeptidase family protein n=1 Tax=Sorangium atrum TaxID=2995308 RepID=A0ABT5CAS1_9BACT|nr:L,D-transpeptidase family protein [Sorangium aterium]MDC0683539.1 L,D-transpeptidase family protein [Sorangium aterium]
MRVRGVLLLPAIALATLSVSCPRPASEPAATSPAPAPAAAVTAPLAATAPAVAAPVPSTASVEDAAPPSAEAAMAPGALAMAPGALAAAPGGDPLALPALPPELVDDGSDKLPELDPPPATSPTAAEEEVHELASIARETWVFAEPRWTSRRIGYLRAGAVVARRPQPSGRTSCAEGWYRIEPNGYVCIGASATLNIHDLAVEASSRRPVRRFASPALPVVRGEAAPATTQPGETPVAAAQTGETPVAAAQTGETTIAAAQPGEATLAATQPGETALAATQPGETALAITQAGASALAATQAGASALAAMRAGDATTLLGGLPYTYVMSRSPTPLLYARLPDEDEQRGAEPDLAAHLLRAATAARAPDFVAPPPPDVTPSVLLYGRPAPGLAGDRRSPGALVLGRARTRSGFALLSTFDHDGRRFGLTTDLAVLPLDRTRVIRPSAFAGLALPEGVTLPVAFARRRHAARLVPGERGVTRAPLRFREAIPLSGASRRVGGIDYLEARDGSLVRADEVVRVDPLPRTPAWAVRGRKWIDVSIEKQSLVAYEGARPVYVTLVSTGADGLGDPKTTRSTIQGLFRIHTKHVTVTMDGDEEEEDPFDFRDVPFVQYFTEGFAFHAAYWHDDFGTPRSHGCVNLSPLDAAWLFEWTTPEVPAEWHGALSLRKGTLVSIRP